MKPKSLNRLVSNYKKQLDGGEIQLAYTTLVKFVMSLKTRFSTNLGDQYSFGSIFQGYMDYTYFYIVNEHYRSRKLKLGLVLNHEKMRFEIWLLGQTKDVQKKYWNRLRKTEWILDDEIPKYSVFNHILVDNPDFDDLDSLSKRIEKEMIQASERILISLEHLETNEIPNKAFAKPTPRNS